MKEERIRMEIGDTIIITKHLSSRDIPFLPFSFRFILQTNLNELRIM